MRSICHKANSLKVEAQKALLQCPSPVPDDSALSYIGGWLAKKHSDCVICQSALTKEEREPFLKTKTFTWARTDSLLSPSVQLMKHLRVWDTMFRNLIQTLSHNSNLSERLTQHFNSFPIPQLCPVHPSLGDELSRRFAVFRLHSFCRFSNDELTNRRSQIMKKLHRLNA